MSASTHLVTCTAGASGKMWDALALRRFGTLLLRRGISPSVDTAHWPLLSKTLSPLKANWPLFITTGWNAVVLRVATYCYENVTHRKQGHNGFVNGVAVTNFISATPSGVPRSDSLLEFLLNNVRDSPKHLPPTKVCYTYATRSLRPLPSNCQVVLTRDRKKLPRGPDTGEAVWRQALDIPSVDKKVVRREDG